MIHFQYCISLDSLDSAVPSLVSSLNNKTNRYAVGHNGKEKCSTDVDQSDLSTDIRFKDPHHHQPPAPVSEMERSRVALITLMCVLIYSISGIIVEMRVKPGDNATIYCDCTQLGKFFIAWFRKPSNEHQPPLVHLTKESTPPHYSRVWNKSEGTFDLLVENITESDLGLYYCALHEMKFTRGRNGERVREDVYHEGNRTTFLSFLGESVHSDLLVLLIWVSVKNMTSTPLDCRIYWKLLLSVCPVFALLSSVVSSTCVHCICRRRSKGVWLSRISGEEVEMKVKPGANAVLSCDCNWKSEYSIVWFRNSSHEHMVIHNEAHPRYSIVWSPFSTTSDLLVRNMSESDLGLYYCAQQKTRPISDKARACSGEDVCLYGNRTTRLSFHGKVSLVPVNTNVFIACVWFSRISGADVEMRVRPGDDVILHSDCVWRHGFDTVWFRNSSHEHMMLLRGAHPRYSTMSNDFHQTSDLLVKNVSESDLGLYFCALQKKRSSGDGARACSCEDVCYYGNRTTRLSFHRKDPYFDLLSPNVHPSLSLISTGFLLL
ncbi:hypothetical protein NFI96_031389 [Prochilodus magdalenae]|nr:hypothetical protein NFI96_031389 [Prochilodus magdalenae]